MSLLLWLPLINGTENQGLLGDITPSFKNFSINDYGKIGKCHKGVGLNYHLSEEILGNQWTLAMWVRSEHWDQYNDILFCKNIDTSTHCQFYISIINGTSLNLGVNGVYSFTTYAYTFEVNKWYHISATYDGNNYVLYINGNMVKSGTCTKPQFTDCVNLGIGLRSQNVAGTSIGSGTSYKSFNDVRVYDTVLSPREIKLISQGLALHYPLAVPGNENLLKDTYTLQTWVGGSGATLSDGICSLHTNGSDWNGNVRMPLDLSLSYSLFKNKIITVSVDVKSNVENGRLGICIGSMNSQGTRLRYRNTWFTDIPTDWKRISLTVLLNDEFFIHNASADIGDYIMIQFYVYFIEETIQLKCPKFELGSTATPWCPASTDPEYSSAGWSDGIEYDCSGYQHNGIRSNITWSGDSPRYNGCYEFDGANYSYVRTNNLDFAVQGSTELTVSEWAYADDWTQQTNAHLWSCTEGGGFNTEAAGSKKIRFPISVYTNAEMTERAYRNNTDTTAGWDLTSLTPGWHMFTSVYTTSGVSTYLDGVLHMTNEFVSYGAHFNLNTNVCLCLGAECYPSNTSRTGNPYFTGKLSDFRLYYTALSADDILELYNTPISLASNGTLLTNSISE